MDYTHTFGLVFGLLTVVSATGNKDKLICRCECGREKIARLSHLRGGTVKSCGCLLLSRPKEVHGKSLASTTLEYKTWDSMTRRCYQESHAAFHNYGGRGITVCDRWRGSDGFAFFIADMGPKQAGWSIDRIDNSKGYGPDNCRWTDMRVQSNNRRGNVYLTSRGQTMTVADWARVSGVSDNTMRERLKRGWAADDAIHKPIRRAAG